MNPARAASVSLSRPVGRALVLSVLLAVSLLPPFSGIAGAVDSAAPTNPRITTSLPAYQKGKVFTVAWAATDDTAVASYDVRYRKAAYTSAALAAPVAFRDATTAISGSFTGAPGNTYCFSVRARDAAVPANVSAFSAERCTAVPINNTTFALRSFANRTGSGYFLNTYSASTTRGATMTRTGVRGRALSLVATKGVGHGTVDVFLGSTKLKRISLAATSTRKNQQIAIGSFSVLRSGTLKIAVVTAGKPVNIEGFGVSNTQGYVTVTGRVLDDAGNPIEGATVTGAAQRASTLPAPSRLSARSATLDIQRQRAARASGGRPLMASAADGTYSISVGPQILPLDILVTATIGGAVPRTMAKWGSTSVPSLAIGDIVLPALAGAEVPIVNGDGGNQDGSVQIENLPTEVTTLYASTYDPDSTTGNAAFPGDFTEGGSIPLNSSGFTWVQGLNSSGGAVHNLSSPATLRSKIPVSQWIDIEDLSEGNEQIDIPIYDFVTTTNTWERHATDGWVENAAGSKLPEENVALIRGGTYSGDIFAVYSTTHFSYMNVDYPYIGPWTLSRVPYAQRQNSCLFNAMQLAKKIALSAAGRAAYQRFNVDGGDLAVELADGRGPELRVIRHADTLPPDDTPAWGIYFGRGRTFPAMEGLPARTFKNDEFALNERIWDSCGNGATAAQEKNTTLMMAATILHETAHWKWNIKHEGGNRRNAEPGGEAGETLEETLFGGVLNMTGGIGSGGTVQRDRTPLTDAQRDALLNPTSWPATAPAPAGVPAPQQRADAAPAPISLTIAPVDGLTTYPLGQEIPVDVTYTNTSTASVKVLNLRVLEGYPLWFDLVKDGTTQRVPFWGPSAKLDITDAHFTTLAPGATLTRRFNLLHGTDGGTLYNLLTSGLYHVQAHYSPLWFPGDTMEAASNTLDLTISPGGAISGTVRDATSNAVISGATLQAKQNEVVIATTTSNGSGAYSFTELPSATDYTVVARGPSYIRQTRTPITVTSGNTTTVNFLLSPLLADGEVRFVLRWGANPRDLDSHLWLPAATPFEVAYYRTGQAARCPWARLDQDVTSGFGPETITLNQTFDGVYTYAIYNYSGGDLTTSGGTVEVFDSTGSIATIPAPTTGSGRWWKVLTYNSTTGAIDESISAIQSADPGPYSSTASGCIPNITSFTPNSGLVGNSVVITGANFTGASAVRFAGVNATSYTVNSDTQITAVIPCGAVAGAITVAGAYGTGTASTSFTPTAPTITSFTPTGGTAGTSVVITGTNFTGACRVQFAGNNAASFAVDSPTQITAVSPTGAPSGAIGVRAAGDVSSAGTFTVPAPTITSFTPTEGLPGESVVITGTDFTGTTAVVFNSRSASFTVNSNTQITATVPTGNAAGSIFVTTGGGTASSTGTFTIPAPTITSFTPTTGPAGTTVVITGNNFTGASAVRFNGVNASFTVNGNTQISASVPGGSASGAVTVVTGGGTATSADTYTVSAPTVASFSPASGPKDTLVTITGTNLVGTSQVLFGSVAAQLYSTSPTQVQAFVPAGFGPSGTISVTTGGGTATSADTFTVPAPTITSFTPTCGGSWTYVTITGTNLTGPTALTFNGTSAPYMYESTPTTMYAYAPGGAFTSGPIAVTTGGGTATSADTFTTPCP